jgi:hypothetical protein
MNSCGVYSHNDSCQEETSPGIFAAAILMAAFYSATALADFTLRIIGMLSGRNRRAPANLVLARQGLERNTYNTPAGSNVVDFQGYKSFRSRRS